MKPRHRTLQSRDYHELIEAFKSELLSRDLDWEERPSSDWRLRLQSWNPGRSLRMLVEAYDVKPSPDLPEEDSVHATVAYFDKAGRFLADAGFGITAYKKALKLIDEVVSERFVIEAFDPASGGISARIGPNTERIESIQACCRSWRQTFDVDG